MAKKQTDTALDAAEADSSALSLLDTIEAQFYSIRGVPSGEVAKLKQLFAELRAKL